MGMKAICEALRPRKREDYRDQVRQLVRELQAKDRTIATLRRKLSCIREYSDEALT